MQEPKPLFLERMHELLPDKKDFQDYFETIKFPAPVSIRCNTLKISPDELKKRLEKKGWKLKQPFENFPEIMIVEGKYKKSDDEDNFDKTNNVSNKFQQNILRSSSINNLKNSANEVSSKLGVSGEINIISLAPGELGKSLEHQLGFFYVQEISSMLPIIALQIKPREKFLDLCSAPGSKTTQAAAKMQNTGLIIANDKTIDRLQILAANLERCGVSNAIMTKRDGIDLCEKLFKNKIYFDKILVDAPCSGEGTFRSSPRGMLMWNANGIRKLQKIQKRLLESASRIIKKDGEIIYSTCTHAPEENEEVVQFAIDELNMKVEKINLPIKCREGIQGWKDKTFDDEIKNCCRIYPQDNQTEGFFVAKLRRR